MAADQSNESAWLLRENDTASSVLMQLMTKPPGPRDPRWSELHDKNSVVEAFTERIDAVVLANVDDTGRVPA